MSRIISWIRYLTWRCVLCGKLGGTLCFECYYKRVFGEDAP